MVERADVVRLGGSGRQQGQGREEQHRQRAEHRWQPARGPPRSQPFRSGGKIPGLVNVGVGCHRGILTVDGTSETRALVTAAPRSAERIHTSPPGGYALAVEYTRRSVRLMCVIEDFSVLLSWHSGTRSPVLALSVSRTLTRRPSASALRSRLRHDTSIHASRAGASGDSVRARWLFEDHVRADVHHLSALFRRHEHAERRCVDRA